MIGRLKVLFAQMSFKSGRPTMLSARFQAFTDRDERMHGWGGTFLWQAVEAKAARDAAVVPFLTRALATCRQWVTEVDDFYEGQTVTITRIDLARQPYGLGVAIHRYYDDDAEFPGQLMLEQDGQGVLRLNQDQAVEREDVPRQVGAWLDELAGLVLNIRLKREMQI